MPTSLVGNLRPAARDQLKLRDRVLRATVTAAENTFRGNSTVLQAEMGAYASFAVTLAGDSSSFGIDGSNDLVAWFPLDAQILGQNNAPASLFSFFQENQALVGTVPTTIIAGNKQSRFVRVRAVTASSSRNTAVTLTLSQTPFTPTRPTKHLGPDNAWSYVAAAGGITTATSVVLKATVNLYHRTVLAKLQLANGGATATEVQVQDGSTVIWRTFLPAGATQNVDFDPPLRGSANTALNLNVVTAGAAVYANAQGLTALA